jgi:hypothetical protein
VDEARVLDIPAIPYAEVEVQQKERQRVVEETARNGGTRKRKPARKAKRGEIGPQVVAAVDAKTKTGMNRTQAFAAVAHERGSRPGTVAANYYRVQRKQNPQALKPRGTRKRTQMAPRSISRPRAAQTRSARTASSDGAVNIDQLATNLVTAVNALATAITTQQRETQQLRARIDEVRSALA